MRTAVLAFLAACVLGALAALAQQGEAPNGVLLVAKPSLVDPNFRETVVLVTQAPDASTIGVILNRPSGRKNDKGEPLFAGGPVMPQVTVALFAADRPPAAAAFHVMRGVYLSIHPAVVDAMPMRPGQRYRLYAGFSGWAPRQLERELELDSWFVLPASEELVFRADTRGMWRELVDKAGGTRAGAPGKPAILAS